jgi:hypothetical protein
MIAACGGSVEGGSGEGSSAETSPQPSEGSPRTDAATELGTCKLGPKEDYRVACRWVADGRCYDEREMACNCACPRSGTSQCASGFDGGPDGHVWVSCD